MSGPLVAVVAAQLGLLLVVSVILSARRWYAGQRARRRAAEREGLARILRDVLMGRAHADALRHAIDAADGDTVAVVLQQHAAQLKGDAWTQATAQLRQTRWFHEFVRTRWNSRAWWRRLVGARMLGILGERRDLPVALGLAKDPHPAVRVAAVAILRRVHEAELLETTFDAAATAPRVMRRHFFNTLLAVPHLLVPVLDRRLREPAGSWALRALIDLAGEVGAPELLDRIVAHASHASVEIRVATARALGSYPHPTARDTLLSLLTDPFWQVRARAAASLGAMRALEAHGAVRTALRDANWWVRLRAAVALRQLGEPGVQVLAEAERGGDRFGGEMARYVLGLSAAAVADHLA